MKSAAPLSVAASPRLRRKIPRVDMSPQLAETLRTLKETRELEASLTSKPMSEWVFIDPTGRRLGNQLLRCVLFASLEKAGLRCVRFHDLRHTFANLLIQQEANPKYIQQQLGHGSISITLDIYSHLFRRDDRHYVNRLDDTDVVPVETPLRKSESQPSRNMTICGNRWTLARQL